MMLASLARRSVPLSNLWRQELIARSPSPRMSLAAKPAPFMRIKFCAIGICFTTSFSVYKLELCFHVRYYDYQVRYSH